MPITVSPDEANPTHHALLKWDGDEVGLSFVNSKGELDPLAITQTPVQRTALKTTSGATRYTDFEPPWSPLAQIDWAGGRGMEDFDDDVTRYLDACRMNTSAGPLILGVQESLTTGYRDAYAELFGSLSWYALNGSTTYIAHTFDPGATFDATAIYIHIRRVGTPTAALTVKLCSDSGGDPGSVLQSQTVTTSTITDTLAVLHKFAITAQTLTNGVDYWVQVYCATEDADNYWAVGCAASSGDTKTSSDGSAWSAASLDLYFRVTDADDGYQAMFFTYKEAQYKLRNKTGSAPELYINGDRGVADSNAGDLTKTNDGTKSWTVDEWIGSIVMVVGGPGYEETKRWRVITDNDGTSLTSATWEITHTTATEYVILGSDIWTEIAGHGMTGPVTDVCVAAGIVYYAQGESINIRRHRWTAGALDEWAADGANKSTYLEVIRDATNGNEVWRGNNTATPSISNSDTKAWGTDLVFGAAISFNDSYGRINNLLEYDDKVWVMREGMIHAMATDGTIPDDLPLPEIQTLRGDQNGKAATPHNNYLWFNWGYGIERYYSSALDDIGPNRDEGLPSDRQGIVSDLLGYPGRVICAVDGDTSNYSSVLIHNALGWHEIYRAPVAGQRIKALSYEATPGSTPDRLWISVGSDTIYIPFPSMSVDPTKDTNMTYTHEASITSGWFYAGLVDVEKFFYTMKVFGENLTEDSQWCEIAYQLDDDTAWTPVTTYFEDVPMSEVELAPENIIGLTGKRFRYRLVMRTTDNSVSPKIKSIVLETVARVPLKYAYQFNFRVFEDDVDLDNGYMANSLDDVDKLRDLAKDLTPVTARFVYGQFDNKVCFVDPISLRPMTANDADQEGYIGTMTLVEV